MATYKVIQDIEAEDKLLGPLTLRQFIYAAIVAVMGFIAFKLVFVKWFLAIPLLPPMVLFAVLAAPFGHDQSSEVWLLAKIRFFLKPHRRIWDQSGVKELVTVTAPKKIERRYTNGLSQEEVQSRLHALAATIDSRGWAIKNVNVNLITQPSYISTTNSDRLIDPTTIPQEVPNFDITVADDMLDERNNPTAQNLDRLINDTAQKRREELISKMQHPEQAPPRPAPVAPSQQPQPAAPPADFWFMNGTNGQAPQVAPGFATFDHNPLITPSAAPSVTPFATGSTTAVSADEEELLKKIKEEKNRPDPMHSHLKTILPLSEQERMRKEALEKRRVLNDQQQAAQAITADNAPVTAPADPAILELANNDDLNVATIARQANKAMQRELEDGEVIINLH